MSNPIITIDRMMSGVDISVDAEAVRRVMDLDCYALQITISNSASIVGEIDIMASNDNVNFGTVLSSTISVTQDDTVIVNVEEPAYMYLKVKYTATSGSANLDVFLSGKRGT